jgi:translation elongation factor EF-1alpha
MDLYNNNAQQAKERFDEVCAEVQRVIAKKFTMASFCFIPVSAWTGMNLIVHDDVGCSWWTSTEVTNSVKEIKVCSCLFEAMDHMGAPHRDLAGPFRMPINTVFKIQGVGTVISGRVIRYCCFIVVCCLLFCKFYNFKVVPFNLEMMLW